MKYLITGHTGFKGAWLSLILQIQGHEVCGVALDPQSESLFVKAELQSLFKKDYRVDIRNFENLLAAVHAIDPDFIIHFAAQPLVGESYKKPLETFETNVLGTLNILEATRKLKNLQGVLIVTTDKVYKNRDDNRAYSESDELGGADPYSASKSAADIAAQSWIRCFATVPMAIARAGNVIGGGDWATDRIIPDLISAYSKGQIPLLRYPNSIRPWQHVLDCLNGYLKLINHMLESQTGGVFNFGPDPGITHSVGELAELVATHFKVNPPVWTVSSEYFPPETGYLALDSSLARSRLSWHDKLDFKSAVDLTVNWYKDQTKKSAFEITTDQINFFLEN